MVLSKFFKRTFLFTPICHPSLYGALCGQFHVKKGKEVVWVTLFTNLSNHDHVFRIKEIQPLEINTPLLPPMCSCIIPAPWQNPTPEFPARARPPPPNPKPNESPSSMNNNRLDHYFSLFFRM